MNKKKKNIHFDFITEKFALEICDSPSCVDYFYFMIKHNKIEYSLLYLERILTSDFYQSYLSDDTYLFETQENSFKNTLLILGHA